MSNSKISSNQDDPCNHEMTEIKVTVGQALHLEALLDFVMKEFSRNAELEDIRFAAQEARRKGVETYAIREAKKKFGAGQ